MKRNIILFISIIFVFVTVISVTFGMWTISNSNGGTGNFVSKAEKAINTNDFIYYDTTKGNGEGIDCFSYYKTGFLNEDGSLALSGNLTVYYILNFDLAKERFTTSDGFNTLIELKCIYNGTGSYNIFDSTSSKINMTYNCYFDNSTTPYMNGSLINDGLITIAYSQSELASMSGEQEFKIVFTFTTSSLSDFTTYVYPKLNDIKFAIETKFENIE